MENNNPGKENELSTEAQKKIKDITEEETQKAQWRSELMASETVRKYFEQFETTSVERFIDDYLFNKKMWVQYGETYAKINENEALRFDNEAQEFLKWIQQKKLFEAQCLWRAEKIQLPGVRLTYDFLLWEDDVLNCPFIEPITEEDIALCYQYLLEGKADKYEAWVDFEWQNYDEIKAGYNGNNQEGCYPDWYEYIDERKGMSNVLLPDIKGQKESFYRDLYFDSQKEIQEAREAAYQKTVQERKPYLSWQNDDATAFLLNTFESKEIRYLYNAYENGTDDLWEREDVLDMFKLLESAEEPVPIEANDNWLVGLEKAVNKYKCKKIAEALPRVWEQYNMNIQMGIAFPKEHCHFESAYEVIHQQILAGRKLNGEPRDLNF